MKAFALALVVVCSLLALPAQALDRERFAIGVHGNAGLTMFGFPMPTGGPGIDARVHVLGPFSIQPHAAGLLGIFPMVGTIGAQVGAPVCAEAADGKFIGAGPLIAWTRFIGHVEEPVPTYTIVGGELVAGFVIPFSSMLEAVLQGRAQAGTTLEQPSIIQISAGASAGLRLTF